jgi:hypothetical protein
MTNSESFALNQWLSDYPADMSYDDIIERLSVPNQWMAKDLPVWSLVENNTTDQVADFIENTKRAYERSLTFGEQQ